MTSFYGRRCSLNHIGMLVSGMSALAVLSLLDMYRVCSVPCLDTNKTWREEVRIWICGAVIIIFVLEDRSTGGVGGAESRRYDQARLAILWCSICINWLQMGRRDRIFITGLLFASQAWSLHHRIDRARPQKEWVDGRARYFARSRLHHRCYKLLRISLALRLEYIYMYLIINSFFPFVRWKRYLSREPVSHGRVCITGATNYYAVVWHFVYNIFIYIYL